MTEVKKDYEGNKLRPYVFYIECNSCGKLFEYKGDYNCPNCYKESFKRMGKDLS